MFPHRGYSINIIFKDSNYYIYIYIGHWVSYNSSDVVSTMNMPSLSWGLRVPIELVITIWNVIHDKYATLWSLWHSTGSAVTLPVLDTVRIPSSPLLLSSDCDDYDLNRKGEGHSGWNYPRIQPMRIRAEKSSSIISSS